MNASQAASSNSAANVRLTGRNLALFNAAMNIHKSSSGERNDLAHAIFGIVSDTNDELIWCPAKKFAAWITRANQKAWNLENDPDPHAPLRWVEWNHPGPVFLPTKGPMARASGRIALQPANTLGTAILHAVRRLGGFVSVRVRHLAVLVPRDGVEGTPL